MRVEAARVPDGLGNDEALGHDGFGSLDIDLVSIGVAEHVRLSGLQHTMDTVDQPCGDRAQGLLVVVTLFDHQPLVYPGEIRIDASSNIGRQVQSSFDAVNPGAKRVNSPAE